MVRGVGEWVGEWVGERVSGWVSEWVSGEWVGEWADGWGKRGHGPGAHMFLQLVGTRRAVVTRCIANRYIASLAAVGSIEVIEVSGLSSGGGVFRRGSRARSEDTTPHHTKGTGPWREGGGGVVKWHVVTHTIGPPGRPAHKKWRRVGTCS